MCEHGTDVLVVVNIPARLSHTGRSYWTVKGIDECIAPIVHALTSNGILTAASCCGHGRGPGSIVLQDGRELTIYPKRKDNVFIIKSIRYRMEISSDLELTLLISTDSGPFLPFLALKQDRVTISEQLTAVALTIDEFEKRLDIFEGWVAICRQVLKPPEEISETVPIVYETETEPSDASFGVEIENLISSAVWVTATGILTISPNAEAEIEWGSFIFYFNRLKECAREIRRILNEP